MRGMEEGPRTRPKGQVNIFLLIFCLAFCLKPLTLAHPLSRLATLRKIEALLSARAIPAAYHNDLDLNVKDRDLDDACTRYDGWQRPLEGSTPADIQPYRQSGLDNDEIILDSKAIVLLYAADSLVKITDLLATYQDLEIHRVADFRFIAYTGEPWNLKRRAPVLYTVVSTYVQIINFYRCVLEAEIEDWYMEEEPLDFYRVEQGLMGILGGIYPVLTSGEIDNIHQLTSDENVTMAEEYMREARGHGVRRLLRAHLVWEIRDFLLKVVDDAFWADDKSTNGKEPNVDYKYPENLSVKFGDIPVLYKRQMAPKDDTLRHFGLSRYRKYLQWK